MSVLPQPQSSRLDDVLVILSEITDSGELEAFLRQLNLTSFEPGLGEVDKARLMDAVYAATARCWSARSRCGGGEC
jgi:hypothetical protein